MVEKNEELQQRVVHVDFPSGNTGNKMLQYMAAIALARRIGGCSLSGIKIPEWGINIPTIAQDNPRVLRISSPVSKKLNFDDIARKFWDRSIDRVELNIYSSHIGNLLPKEEYRNLFLDDGTAKGFGRDTLLIHIRGDDVLRGNHRQYTVLPIEFYLDLIDTTKLTPVFIGQLTDHSRYVSRLKETFPNAPFISSSNKLRDFNIMRKSMNMVTSVSTFAWLAAWLSDADRVFMPLSGFCNPLQYPDADLMPSSDSRFSFYLFPVNHAVPDELIEEAHKALIGKWRAVTYEEVRHASAAKA